MVVRVGQNGASTFVLYLLYSSRLSLPHPRTHGYPSLVLDRGDSWSSISLGFGYAKARFCILNRVLKTMV